MPKNDNTDGKGNDKNNGLQNKPKFVKTNSEFLSPDPKAEGGFTSREITDLDRNLVGNKTYDRTKTVNTIYVGILSQEASALFSKKYHKRHRNGTPQSFQKQLPVDQYSKLPIKELTEAKEIKKTDTMQIRLSKNVGNVPSSKYTNDPNSNHATFIQDVFQNKRINDVIVVIEGESDILEREMTLKDVSNDEHKYKLVLDKNNTDQPFRVVTGVKKPGEDESSDESPAVQYMHFYVRDAMEGVVSFEQVQIPRSNGFSFGAGKIGFSTTEKEKDKNTGKDTGKDKTKKYGILAVHIPNEYVGDQLEVGTDKTVNDVTDKAFKTYAAERLADTKNPETIVCYGGDTNYTKVMDSNALPSVGGVIKGGETIAHHASSAKNFTYLIQLKALNNEDSSFGVQQASKVNNANPNFKNHQNSNGENFKGGKIGTDHPSCMFGVELTGKLLNTLSQVANNETSDLNVSNSNIANTKILADGEVSVLNTSNSTIPNASALTSNISLTRSSNLDDEDENDGLENRKKRPREENSEDIDETNPSKKVKIEEPKEESSEEPIENMTEVALDESSDLVQSGDNESFSLSISQSSSLPDTDFNLRGQKRKEPDTSNDDANPPPSKKRKMAETEDMAEVELGNSSNGNTQEIRLNEDAMSDSENHSLLSDGSTYNLSKLFSPTPSSLSHNKSGDEMHVELNPTPMQGESKKSDLQLSLEKFSSMGVDFNLPKQDLLNNQPLKRRNTIPKVKTEKLNEENPSIATDSNSTTPKNEERTAETQNQSPSSSTAPTPFNIRPKSPTDL